MLASPIKKSPNTPPFVAMVVEAFAVNVWLELCPIVVLLLNVATPPTVKVDVVAAVVTAKYEVVA